MVPPLSPDLAPGAVPFASRSVGVKGGSFISCSERYCALLAIVEFSTPRQAPMLANGQLHTTCYTKSSCGTVKSDARPMANYKSISQSHSRLVTPPRLLPGRTAVPHGKPQRRGVGGAALKPLRPRSHLQYSATPLGSVERTGVGESRSGANAAPQEPQNLDSPRLYSGTRLISCLFTECSLHTRLRPGTQAWSSSTPWQAPMLSNGQLHCTTRYTKISCSTPRKATPDPHGQSGLRRAT